MWLVSSGEREQWMGNSSWDRELVLGNGNSGWGTAGGTGGYLVLGNENSGWGTDSGTGVSEQA